MKTINENILALNGGPKLISKPLKQYNSIGVEEKSCFERFRKW